MKKLALLRAGTALMAVLLSCDASAWSLREGAGYLLGEEEYVYGFPLVMMDVTREVTTAATKSGEYAAPINQFARIRTYVSPDFKNVVRISVNSLWSFGFVDLDKEPMIVTIPDAGSRYLVMQALNMWTDDFASAGTRTPEKKSGNFLIAGPKWTGTAPPGIKDTFRSSTRYAWVLVQVSASTVADFPAIHAIQDQLKITPLSSWGKPYTPPASMSVDPNVDLTATPFDQVRIMTGEMFFRRLAKVLKDNPPCSADARMMPSASNVWSVSQYRENFYVRNQLNRYGVLSSMPFKYNTDGSLDIYVQAKSPGSDKESNWLPTPPTGAFNFSTRNYQPRQEVLDGSYKLPPVTRMP